MGESPTAPDPGKKKDLGAIPKSSNIPVKMDVVVASTKRKAQKSSDDSLTPPASPTATKRKVAAAGETLPKTDMNLVSSFNDHSVPLLDEARGGSDDSPVGEKTSSSVFSPLQARVRAYPMDFAGPFYVFFRSKGKPLNVLQISRDLSRLYSAVTRIEKIGGKLRVTVGNAKQANDIACNELFLREWNVYVPSRNVEVVGVVTEGSLTESELSKSAGVFKNPLLPSVRILKCR